MYYMDITDPANFESEAYKKWSKFMDEYYPDGDKTSAFTAYGYLVGQTMEQVLKQAGDNLTRENVMKEAANLDLDLDMMLPGIKIQTSPTDFFPIEAMMPVEFTGEKFNALGKVVSVN